MEKAMPSSYEEDHTKNNVHIIVHNLKTESKSFTG